MGRKFFVGGNWKRNGTTEEMKKIVTTLNEPEVPSEDVVDDLKNSHLKKLEEGDERLTLLRAHFIGCKKLCSAKCKRSGRNGSAGVSHIAALVDNQLGHEFPYNAIVKVIRTGPPNPDFSRPWQKEEDNTHESLGFIARERIVLTCAHSVDGHKKVELKKLNSDRLYPARVLSVAPDCDIAMLTVDGDEEFWKGVVPLEFGAIPAEGDKVIIMGYRIKSDLKISKRGVLFKNTSKSGKVRKISGCVSSVDMVTYLHCGTKLLAFQVDTDVGIKPGSSGGPIFNRECECVGMTFQATEFRADFIPPEVIEHFMHDYDKNRAYTGIPILAVKWQKMVNLDLRKSMKMKDDQQGVLIIEVKPNYPEYESLKPGDVIVSIDGIDIGNDGKVLFDGKLRIEFTYVVTKRYTGDNIDLKVIRNSEIKELKIKLATHKQFIQENISGRPLPYYIMAGIVFTTLSFRYLEDLKRRRRFNQHNQEVLKSESLYDEGTYHREELLSQALYEECVVVCEVLEDAINVGYHDEPGIVHFQVLTVNDMPVQNLESLARTVENWDGEFLVIILENQKHLVVKTNEARASITRILAKYNVPSAMSDDLTEKLKQGGQDDLDSDLEGEQEQEQKLVMETNSARASTPDILDTCDILAGISDNLKEKLILAEQDGQHDWDLDWEWEQEQEQKHNRELVMGMYGMIVAEQDGQHDGDSDWEREQEREHNRKLVVETNSERASTPDILDTCDIPPGISDDLKEKLIVEKDGQHDWKSDWDREWEHEQEQEKIYKD